MSPSNLYKKNMCAAIIFCLVVLSLFVFSEKSYGASIFELLNGNTSHSKIKSVKNNIDFKRKEAKHKINELKMREKREVNKLQKNQMTLEETKNDLQETETELSNAQTKLIVIKSELFAAKSQYNQAEIDTSTRIRQIYKGERLGLFHLFLEAKDINSLLDRIYYQKRLAKQDKQTLKNMREEASRLARTTARVESQKDEIVYTMSVINDKKRAVSNAINNGQFLINKLRTDRATFEESERDLAAQSNKLVEMLASNPKSKKNTFKTISPFLKPVNGVLTSPFGWRKHPIFGSRSFHSGVDLAGPNGSSIRSANSGKVVYAGWYGGYGKVVIVSHGSYKGTPTSTLYAHMSRIAVGVGDKVSKGQQIGSEGTTGYSTGPHLHFEVRLDGKPTNPLRYI